MANSLLGPNSASLSNDAMAHVCHFLSLEDLKPLQFVNHETRTFITKEYPFYDRKAPRPRELTALQKLELQFLKFQDRPVWQRVTILALCIVLSPLILAYHSPKLLQKFYISVIEPCAQTLLRSLGNVVMKIYQDILSPLACFIYNRALVPLCTTIGQIAEFIFFSLPRNIDHYILRPLIAGAYRVLTPVAQAIQSAAIGLYNHVLTPLLNALSRVAEALFITLPQKVWSHLLVPTWDWIVFPALIQLEKAISFLFNRVVIPVVNSLSVIAQGLFVTFPQKVWNHLLVPTWNWIVLPGLTHIEKVISFLFNRVIIPVAKVLGIVLEGICISFPYKIYTHILCPLGRALGAIFQFTYDKILTPLGQAIQKISSVIFKSFIIPMTHAVLLGSALLYTHVLLPTVNTTVELCSIVGQAISRNL